ncbi:MAG TPA: efflux RND transporter periplasmic adaptor subunit [Pyrinomonadaceae bacterium]|jgi:membrane fusion protein (multidrug efflux system)
MNNLHKINLSVSAAAALLAVAVLINSGCKAVAPTKTEAAVPPPPVVVVVDVVQKTVPIFSEYVGQTKAAETVEVRARVEGILQRIYFREGTPVRKGALLFTIDKAPYVATLQSAKAALSKAEADLAQSKQRTDVIQAEAELADAQATLSKTEQDLKRLLPLAREKAVTEIELDAATAAEKSARAIVKSRQANVTNLEGAVKYTIERSNAEVSAAKARIIQAELDVSYCDIYSPFSGVIGFKNVDEGNLVGRGDATLLATISQSDPLMVDVSLSEIEFLNLTDPTRGGGQRGGRRIEMMLANDTTLPYPGSLRVVDRTVDPQTGTLKVQVSFQNPGSYLRPGQFARIRAVVEEVNDAVVIPLRAVQELQGAKTVMVVDTQNKASVRTITVGQKSENEVIVLDGLKAGERVIVEGMQKVRPGSEVKLAEGATTPPPSES